jgi:hypothetical protein
LTLLRKSLATALLATLLPLTMSAAQAEIPIATLAEDWCRHDDPARWRDERACEPRRRLTGTLPERLVAPLPCGRGMVFRRIDVPVRDLLGHRPTDLGGAPSSNDFRLRYAQAVRFDAVAGGFSIDPQDRLVRGDYAEIDRRAYYIAAYETTRIQWALYETGALASAGKTPADADALDAACRRVAEVIAETNPRRVEAQAGMSYFEALDFIRDLNGFFVAENRRRLAVARSSGEDETLSLAIPWERGSPGFVRLPSEAEWEFAARGGALTDASLSGQTYAIREGDNVRMANLEEIANISGRGRAEPHVGAKSPNLAGLYDTVGNVEEIVHDLFRMIRPDGPHGARGGYVLRGGDMRTPKTVLGVGRRVERPFFDANGEAATPLGGVRVALVAPVFPDGWSDELPFEPNIRNTELDPALERAHERMISGSDGPGADFRAQARTLVAELKQDSADAASTIGRIRAIEEALSASEAAVNAAEEERIAATVLAAVNTIQNVRLNGRIAVTYVSKERDNLAQLSCLEGTREGRERKALVTRLRQQTDAVERQIDFQVRYALGLLEELARDEPTVVADKIQQTMDRFERDGLAVFDKAWELFETSYARVDAAPEVDFSKQMVALFDDVREFRRNLRSRPLPNVPCR